MGSKRSGFLNKDFVANTIKYFTKGSGRLDDVRTLRAIDKDESQDGTDTIDFLDEKLYCRDELDLPTGDADKHYAVRKRFLKTCFSDNLDYIARVYGTTG